MEITKLTDNLKALGYSVSCFDRKEDAASYLVSVLAGATVGFGGSVTLQEMGLYEALMGKASVFWHWKSADGKSAISLAQDAQYYLCSVNALAESGEIVNIDGNCNRVAAMVYGHKKVFFVVGVNKICESLDEAVARARNVAAPKNAQRLNRKTPCAVKGDRCYSCKSPERICKNLSVLWQKPSAQDIEVVIIGESLGY
jgi:hypothetical protein